MRYLQSPEALHSEIGDDIVALQVQRGLCFGMERVTADVWRLLEQEITLEELCIQLGQQYEVDPATCRAEVGRLLEVMVQEGLVRTGD